MTLKLDQVAQNGAFGVDKGGRHVQFGTLGFPGSYEFLT